MSSIGPQLPDHLSKRKRTPDEDGDTDASSPQPKQARSEPSHRNKDELALEDDEESGSQSDLYGPSVAGFQNTATKPTAGPSLPSANKDEIDLDDDDDDETSTGPAAPSQQTAVPATGASSNSSSQPNADRGGGVDASSSSDDEDDYGPALPSTSTAHRKPIGPSLPSSEPAPKRDDWMLAPPTSTSYSERDPTKIRARKFASSKGSKPSSGGDGVSAIWTETPEEKLRRQKDAVLGRSKTGADGSGAQQGAKAARGKEEEERDARIAARVEAQRGASLYDEHQKRRDEGRNQQQQQEEEDDPSKRGFDREKDMALGGKINTTQRRELMNNAANFGGRFSKGSYL